MPNLNVLIKWLSVMLRSKPGFLFFWFWLGPSRTIFISFFNPFPSTHHPCQCVSGPGPFLNSHACKTSHSFYYCPIICIPNWVLQTLRESHLTRIAPLYHSLSYKISNSFPIGWLHSYLCPPDPVSVSHYRDCQPLHKTLDSAVICHKPGLLETSTGKWYYKISASANGGPLSYFCAHMTFHFVSH